jgi:hydrogenase expression/formation protein HypE
LVERVLSAGKDVKLMRDLTRGGLATVLAEIVNNKSYGITVEEDKIPVKEDVTGMCEILGLEPIYIANEGKLLMVVGKEDAESTMKILKDDTLGREASIIGEVVEMNKGQVLMKTEIGGTRIIDMLAGEQLPRIC